METIKKFRLAYKGLDKFDRLVFISELGRYYKQYEGESEIYTSSAFEGEPDMPLTLKAGYEFEFIGLPIFPENVTIDKPVKVLIHNSAKGRSDWHKGIFKGYESAIDDLPYRVSVEAKGVLYTGNTNCSPHCVKLID